MDLEFKNQDIILSDEYNYKRIANAIKNLLIGKNSYYSLKDNFNGFVT